MVPCRSTNTFFLGICSSPLTVTDLLLCPSWLQELLQFLLLTAVSWLCIGRQEHLPAYPRKEASAGRALLGIAASHHQAAAFTHFTAALDELHTSMTTLQSTAVRSDLDVHAAT